MEPEKPQPPQSLCQKCKAPLPAPSPDDLPRWCADCLKAFTEKMRDPSKRW